MFPPRTLSTLEFDKIKQMLAACAATDGAKAKALALIPSGDFDAVFAAQEQTDAAKRLVNAKGFPSFSAS